MDKAVDNLHSYKAFWTVLPAAVGIGGSGNLAASLGFRI